MADDDVRKSKFPVLPFVGDTEPWINVINMFGIPWTLLVCMFFFIVPMGKDAGHTLESLNTQAKEAVPLLKEIHTATITGSRQRHQDTQAIHQELQEAATVLKAKEEQD